jgi:hypothetical protein
VALWATWRANASGGVPACRGILETFDRAKACYLSKFGKRE